MASKPTDPTSWSRVCFCALAAGLLFAVTLGVESSGAGGSGGDRTGAWASERTDLDPGPALAGLVVGAAAGGVVGLLWGRRGLAGAVGFALVTLAGGCAGLVVAGLAGAETRVTVTENAVSAYHGTAPAVLAGGAALGLALGALVAWRFGRPSSPGGARVGLAA
jgi:hypothetical protein